MSEREKILIVDDEPDTVTILQDRLEMDNYEVMTAADGYEALEQIDQEMPDLVLLDIKMLGFRKETWIPKVKVYS